MRAAALSKDKGSITDLPTSAQSSRRDSIISARTSKEVALGEITLKDAIVNFLDCEKDIKALEVDLRNELRKELKREKKQKKKQQKNEQLQKELKKAKEKLEYCGEKLAAVYFEERKDLTEKFSSFDTTFPLFEQAQVILKRLATLYFEKGKDLTEKFSNSDEAFPLFEKTLDILKAIDGMNSSLAVSALNSLGHIYTRRSEFKKALEKHTEALKISENVDGENYSSDAEVDSLTSLGDILQSTGQFEEALNHYERALAIQENVYEPNPRELTQPLLSIGKVYLARDQFEEALIHLRRALAISEDVNNPDLGIQATLLNDLGIISYKREQLEEAESYFTRAFEIQKKIHEDNSPEISATLCNLGAIYLAKGETENALEYYQSALKIQETNYKDYKDRSHHFIPTITNLGNIYLMRGEFKQALKNFEEALAISTKVFKANSPTAKAHCNLGRAYAQEGQFEKALEQYQAAVNIFRKSELSQSYLACHARKSLAELHAKLASDPSHRLEAEEHLQSAINLYEEILHIDEAILNSDTSLSPYELTDHLQLLEALSVVYRRQRDILKAAELYKVYAVRYQTSLPSISYFCAEQAIQHYTHCPNTHAERAQLWALKAEICMNQPGHLVDRIAALTNWEHAKKLSGSTEFDERIKNVADTYRKKQSLIDLDILGQLEHCVETYHELGQLHLQDFKENVLLSEYTKNRTTEVFIKLRNILDQAFTRFVREVFPANSRENDPAEHKSSYFPIRGSKAALDNGLEQQGVLASTKKYSPQDLTKKFQLNEALSIPNPQKHQPPLGEKGGGVVQIVQSLLTELTNQQYLEKRKVDKITYYYSAKKFNDDPTLINLNLKSEPNLKLFRNRFAKILNLLCDLSKPITSEILAEELAPPADEIIKGLHKSKYLTADVQKDPFTGEEKVCSYEIEDIDTVSTLAWKDLSPDDSDLITPFSEKILQRLKTLSQAYPKKASLDRDYPRSYNLVVGAQSFSYFDPNRVKDDPWLAPLTAINVDSKHIRLTPQEICDSLTQQSGLIRKHNRGVKIHYTEPRLHEWSFVDDLPKKYSIVEQFALSSGIYNTLVAKQHINLQKANHQLTELNNYLEAKRKHRGAILSKKSQNEINLLDSACKQAEKAYRQKVKADLSKEHKKHADLVATVMLANVQQDGHVADIEPNQLVEVLPFFDKAIRGVTDVVEGLGLDRQGFRLRSGFGHHIDLVFPNLTLLGEDTPTTDQSTEALQSKILNRLAPLRNFQAKDATTFSLDELKEYNSVLREIGRQFVLCKQSKVAASLYYDAAKQMETTFPWLALQFYDEALYFEADRLSSDNHESIEIKKTALCELLGLYRMPILYFKALRQHTPKLSDVQTAQEQRLMKLLNVKTEIIDQDIYSQIEYCKEQYYKLLHEWFCEYPFTDNPFCKEQLQNRIAALIIKIQSLLDQTYLRFLKETIYQSNQKEDQEEIYYPHGIKSKNDLMGVLLEKEVFSCDLYLFDKKEAIPEKTIAQMAVVLIYKKPDNSNNDSSNSSKKSLIIKPPITCTAYFVRDGAFLLRHDGQLVTCEVSVPVEWLMSIDYGQIKKEKEKTNYIKCIVDALNKGDLDLITLAKYPKPSSPPGSFSSTTPQKKSCITDYPDCCQMLMNSQLFSDGEWLEKIVAIANQSKHEKLACLKSQSIDSGFKGADIVREGVKIEYKSEIISLSSLFEEVFPQIDLIVRTFFLAIKSEYLATIPKSNPIPDRPDLYFQNFSTISGRHVAIPHSADLYYAPETYLIPHQPTIYSPAFARMTKRPPIIPHEPHLYSKIATIPKSHQAFPHIPDLYVDTDPAQPEDLTNTSPSSGSASLSNSPFSLFGGSKSLVQSLEDNTYWYNDTDIDVLLKKQLNDDVEVFIAAACYPYQRISGQDSIQPAKIFQDIVLKSALKRATPTVLPISNLEKGELDPNGLSSYSILGNHWMGMVILPNPISPTKPTILYIDPYGHPGGKDYRIPSTDLFNLSQSSPFPSQGSHWSRICSLIILLAQINLDAELIVSGLQQQTDGVSCGPLCVDNLVTLVKQQGELETLTIPDVRALRANHEKLKNTSDVAAPPPPSMGFGG